jgi:allantoicase
VTRKLDKWVRLEQPRLGSRVTWASDEFFGAKERLIDPAEPVFIADRYDEHGKWMDGWESRRKREPGHDCCIVRLGVAGIIHGFDVDTSHFTGNYLRNDTVLTHVRMNIYPDGGVARLRIFGEIRADFSDIDGYVDLAAVEHGGRPIACSDQHYGSVHNLLAPGRGQNMGDGWETARRRGPGNDWVIIALGRPAVIERAEIDTAHFKGNYPDRVSLEGAMFASDREVSNSSPEWDVLLQESKLKMDQQHYFDAELQDIGPVSHVRVSIYPDGGLSRVRLFGQVHG